MSWMNGVSEGDPAAAEQDRLAREERQAAARRYLESRPGDNTDVMMMLGLIESPPPGRARRSRLAGDKPRRRRKVAEAAAVLLLAVLASISLLPEPAHASARGDAWDTLARQAFSSFTYDGSSAAAYTYAAMAEASGLLNGWQDPATAAYLDKVYALQNPDGGWGLTEPWDVFGDGTTNPASTTYTVTLADHVGPALLAGYRAGVVPRARVQGIVDMLVSLPRVPVSRGKCVAYSTQAADARAGLCVHNVNAGVGYFLRRAESAGITNPAGAQLAADIATQEVSTYQRTRRWWAYRDGKPAALQDADHEAYSAQSMRELSYTTGLPAVQAVMARAFPAEQTSPLGHMRLVSTPPGAESIRSWVRGGSRVSLWCQLGDQWLTEAEAYVRDPGQQDRAQRIAQSALFSARNAQACR